jgi:hypothetical protein
MFHRFSTWWRALCVVLLSLAAVAWPTATQALATPSFSVIHQDSVASLSPNGAAHFNIELSQTNTTVSLKMYPRIFQRSQIAPLVTGVGTTQAPIAATNLCSKGGTSTFNVELSTQANNVKTVGECSTKSARLHLACKAASCDGVYPISYSTARGKTEWSLLAIRSTKVLHPLQFNWIESMNATSLVNPSQATKALSVFSKYPKVAVTLGADYQTFTKAALVAPKFLASFKSATQSQDHSIISAPPGNIDFGGLVANGFTAQASNQLDFSKSLVHSLTGKSLESPVLLSTIPSVATLDALAGIGVSNVVFPETALSYAPSNSLHWGSPFHVQGASTLNAMSIDEPLSQIMSNTAIEPGRRAALALGVLGFLHFEAPGLTTNRSVVAMTTVSKTGAKFIDNFLSGLSHNPFVTASPLAPMFDSKAIGSNGSPSTRTMVNPPVSTWSARNVLTLNALINDITSFNQGVGSVTLSSQLSTDVAQSEISGTPSQRQDAIDAARNVLSAELGKFSVNPSTITLAGTGTSLPITLLSKANYTMTAVVHLVTNQLTFPKGANIVTSLDSSTKSLRVPVTNPRNGNLTLRVVVTTPDGHVVLARSAMQVRIAGTSIVGYVLSFGSLFVLALWWVRTSIKRRKERP